MSYLEKKNQFFILLSNPKFLLYFWVSICIIATFKQYITSNLLLEKCNYNNFKIFCYSFEHLLQEKNLYSFYPNQYSDLYHYGPLFGLLIAPFYYLPVGFSLLMWGGLNAWALFKAIWSLPLDTTSKAIIIWISTHNLITSALNVQFNAMCSAMLILSYIYIIHKKDIWATLFIILGTFIKLYGIVGLSFFFFSKNKKKFIIWTGLWIITFLVLPMVICTPNYIIQCYVDWYISLTDKNAANIDILQTQVDVCVMGIVRKITHNPSLSNLYYIIPAIIIMGVSYFKFKLHKQLNFQLALLSSLMMFIVLSSTGSESPTYIIAFPGVGIWYVLERKKNFLTISLLIFTLVISSFSPTDLFPRFIRVNYLQPYAMMALPVFLVWLRLNYLMITNKLKPVSHPTQ